MQTMMALAENSRKTFGLEHTRQAVEEIFGGCLHAKCVESLANGVAGVLHASRLSMHVIGQAYATLAEISPKHGAKQISRMLGNDGVSLPALQRAWVQYVVGQTKEFIIAMDWTDFDGDDHATLCAYTVTTHGRALPLLWKTAKKSELKGRQAALESQLLEELKDYLPQETHLIILADRGFGNIRTYKTINDLNWDHVIRFKDNVVVERGDIRAKGRDWIPPTGRTVQLLNAKVTKERYEVGAVIGAHHKSMKQPWCLATSLTDWKPAAVVKLYSRRFTIEETFRDVKDLRFGMGLRATHIKGTARRDRMLMLVAVAQTLLTLLGAASEASGLDRLLKVNTVKKRTHSLYRQGQYWHSAIPYMRESWLTDLLREFERILTENAFITEFLAQPIIRDFEK